MLLPCTVTEADPVVCLFTCVIVLTIVLSKVNDIVIVFSMFDVVTTKRLVLRTADIVEHKTTVSDLQFVLSLIVLACRTKIEVPPPPKFFPNIVTLLDPVATAFDLVLPEIQCWSYEKRWDDDPPLTPTVAIRCVRVFVVSCCGRTAIHVSDAQLLASVVDPRIRKAFVCDTIPNPEPVSVTEASPVAGVLIGLMKLTPTRSCEIISVTVPSSSAAVNTNFLVPETPCPARHRTEVSESHSVRSQLENTILPIALDTRVPRPAPCTVSKEDPVLARFTSRDEDNVLWSNVKLYVADPTLLELEVTANNRDPWDKLLCDTRNWMLVSDLQKLASEAVLPARYLLVTSDAPKSWP